MAARLAAGHFRHKLGLFAYLFAGVYATVMMGAAAPIQNATQNPPAVRAQTEAHRTKIGEGEYQILEQSNNGAVGPFREEVYDFDESWTLWRRDNGEFEVEGVRRFESPKDVPHRNHFRVELSRDFSVMRMTEFAKLKWVRDSGPLSCEFLPTELHCSSKGSSPAHTMQMRTPVAEPYGLLWPISPFSLSAIARAVERDPAHSTQVELVSIEQPSPATPVAATILTGPLRYLGDEKFEAAGQIWNAHKFSIKVALHPEFLIWTSKDGLLLGLSIEHTHKNWPEEGLRLIRYHTSSE